MLVRSTHVSVNALVTLHYARSNSLFNTLLELILALNYFQSKWMMSVWRKDFENELNLINNNRRFMSVKFRWSDWMMKVNWKNRLKCFLWKCLLMSLIDRETFSGLDSRFGARCKITWSYTLLAVLLETAGNDC